jgi:uncharacterized membrane protein
MKSILTFLAAMTPIFELRGAIPLGIHFGLNPLTIFALAIVGNLIPIFPVLYFLEKGTDLLRKTKLGDRFFIWLFERTRKKSEIVEKYEWWGLMLFVAIPLPGTGAWSGCVAAHVMGLNKFKSFFPIALGVLIAGIIVSTASFGILKLWLR